MKSLLDIEKVRKLSVEDRLELMRAIWNTIDKDSIPFSSEQWEEIQARLSAYRDNPEAAHSYEEYKARIRSLL